jgi:hypothetical protein
LITNIDILKRQKVRRAKLTYMREAGQRRVKEDTKSMQWHVRAEQEKKRLAEEAVRLKGEKEEAEKSRLAAAEAKAEREKTKAEEEAAEAQQVKETPTETPAAPEVEADKK